MSVYYIGPAGNDSNAGTADHPFATLDAANRLVQPGDTVYFLAGTYQNASYGKLDGAGHREIWDKSDSLLRINNVHGTADAPITYAAAPGANVKLQYDGNGAIVIRGSSHIRIEGFEIEGPGTSVSAEDALAAQWSYRMATSVDAQGQPVFEYFERDPAETMATTVADQIAALQASGIDQTGSGKPILFNASAISLPNGSTHIEIVGNNIHHAAAHAIAAQGGNDYVTVRGNTISDCTQLSSNGTHAISFKALDSADASDATKILVEGNTLVDDYNLLVSWVMTKKSVTMAIDEGKPIHVQNDLATADPATGHVWDHGRILIDNNLIVRAGNAGVTVNEARGVTVANNTIVDAGYINRLLDQDAVAGSAWQGFFSGQGLAADFRVASGGVRLTGTQDVTIANNLISISDVRLFAVDAAADVTNANATAANNIYVGGDGLRIRSELTAGDLSNGFVQSTYAGFADASQGDYRLTATSQAVDAGNAAFANIVTTDITGAARDDARIDVGAYEFNGGIAMTEPLTAREAYESALQVKAAAAGQPLVDYMTLQSVDTLANYSYWTSSYTASADPQGTLLVTYSFPVVTGAADEPADYVGNGRSGTLRTFSAEQAAAARLALGLWDDLINVSFVDAGTSTTADTRFFNSTLINTAGGAPAGYGTDGDVWIYNYDQDPPSTRDWSVGSFYFGYWMVHELGHTLGLSHPGGYPGSGYNGLNYLQDSVVYSVMSYNMSGAGAAEAIWNSSASSPMVNDIAAVQYYYGADMTTRTGDTVYGFHSNVTDRMPLNFDAMQAAGEAVAPIAIWDAGGNDTLDLSGFGANADIDLHDGGYTNANGQTMLIGIAHGAVIENAVGGRGNDIIHGNAVGNNVQGGAGNDAIWGGPEAADQPAADPRDFVGIRMNDVPAALAGANDQYISVAGGSAFSGSQFTFEQMVSFIRAPSGTIAFASYATAASDNAFLLEGSGTIKVTIAGKATYNTGVAVSLLMDGEPHRLSLSWDEASGAIALYIDGTSVHSGTYTAAIGANIGTGGTLVLGQEQDSVGGGFNPSQVFQGVMGDIRIFNDVRTAQEIADNAFVRLVGSEQGLVRNWQVAAGDTATIRDVAVVDPPINLTDLMPGAFTATQSSTYLNQATFAATKIFDNDVATYSHTNSGADEWLKLSFSQPLDVSYVEILNRPGQFGRLNGATVTLLDAGNNVIYTSAPISGAGATVTVMLPQDMVASYVRIDRHKGATDTENILNISEVNVYGHAPAGVSVPAALVNTDMTIHNGATVANTAPVIDLTPDNDTLIGGWGDDELHGGAGDDALFGKGDAAPSIFAPTLAVDLNPVGTTGQYATITGFGGIAGAAGAVKFTIEMLARVSHAPGSEVDFFSYANSQTSNALALSAANNGHIQVTFRGSVADTGLSSALLTDGQEHRISLTWDGSTSGGKFTLYIDGVSVYSGVHANQASSLNAGGTLIFGQEQDTIGGGFDANQILPGAIGDIRIFNTVRTAAEIAADAFAPLAAPNTTPGLVANWTAASGNTTSMADARGGTGLTLVGAPNVVRFGSWDDDTLDGGIGNDTLKGGVGNDGIDGGDGTDTAIFEGARSDYQASYAAATHVLTLLDLRSGAPEGTDTITNVEMFQFAGATLTLLQVIETAPTLAAPIADRGTAEDASFVYTLPAGTFADADPGDALTLSASKADGSALPGWLTFDAATGTFSGTPTNADVGTVSVKVAATDTLGASISDTFDIVVSNTNDAPTLAGPIADRGAAEDASFVYTLPAGTFADADPGDALTLSASKADGSALPGWLTFDAATRTFSGTPTNADVGTVSVKVTATDTLGASVSDTFDIVVSNTNDAPTLAAPIADSSATEAVLFSFTVPAGTFADVDAGAALNLSATQADGGALPAWLSFNAATGVLSGTPAHADVGVLHLLITATDTSGASVSDAFDLTVAAAPVVIAPTTGTVSISNASVIEGDSGTATMLFTVTRTGGTLPFDVGYATRDGIAMVEDNDYVAQSGTLHFAEGATSATIAVTVNSDVLTEGDQSFYVRLAGATNGAALGNAVGVGTIVTDDTLPPANTVFVSAPGAITHTGDVDDLVVGSAGADTLFGDGGDDTVFAGAGSDAVYGGADADTLVGNADIFAQEHDLLDGGAGDDKLYGEFTDTVSGGTGYDIVYAVNAYDWSIDLGTGSIELMIADFGNDTIDASTQTIGVEVVASGGNDIVTGSALDDRLWGGIGDDVMRGGGGDDMLFGDLGFDRLFGDAGNDVLYVDGNDTVVDGGAGYDVIYITTGSGMTIDMAAQGLEFVIDLAGGANSISASGMGEGANIYTGGGNDVITGGAFNDVLWAMAGADTISGGAGADVLVGGAGADVLTPGSGDDRTYMNSGGGGDGAFDRIVLTTGWGSDLVYDFEHGTDKIDLSALHTAFAALTLGTTADGSARVTIGGDTLVVFGLGGVLSQGDFVF